MSQFPYDEFSKQIAEVSLELAGQAEPAKIIPGETREIDFYFVPSFSPRAQEVRRDLGLLGRMADRPSAFEFFHNPAEIWEIRSCLGKTAELERSLAKSDNPMDIHLWIITPTLSVAKLQSLSAQANLELSPNSIFNLPAALKTSIVVIHRLPETPDTLWLRILGRGGVFLKAAQEVATLPIGHQKAAASKLLGNLKTSLNLKKNKTKEEEKVMIRLQPAFVEQLEQAKAIGRVEGQVELLLGLIQKRIGVCPTETIAAVLNLNPSGIEALSDVFWELPNVEALQQWLAKAPQSWQKGESY